MKYILDDNNVNKLDFVDMLMSIEISDFLKSEERRGNLSLKGIAKGIQPSFLPMNIKNHPSDLEKTWNQGVIHYTGFLVDSKDKNKYICITGSMDCYLGEIKNLKALSMLKASSELNNEIEVSGEVIGKNPYTLFVSGIKFGDYIFE